jgi:hypothetical protein
MVRWTCARFLFRSGVFAALAVSVSGQTSVARVYPTAEELPANQLKLYLEFSGPMSRGEAANWVRLFESDGAPVELPFVEIDQELWDREQKRLTLLFDPGRIKRGVLPQRELGGALEPGKEYELVIGKGWPDAKGQPLTVEYRKKFRAVEADRTPIDPRTWTILPPAPGTRDPLVVKFGEPLDAAVMLRRITVPGIRGEALARNRETEWHFRPDEPWAAGEYKIVADKVLEDLAGNKIGRPFDVDTFETVTATIPHESTAIAFRIGGK